MFNEVLLKQKIEESGYKLSFIAEKLGISRYTLTNKIKDVTQFKRNEIALLCELLEIPNEDIGDIFFTQIDDFKSIKKTNNHLERI